MTEFVRQQIDGAARLLRNGKITDAISILRPILQEARTIGRAHALYLEAMITAGDHRHALEFLQTSLNSPVDSADAYDALAYFSRMLGQHEISLQMYRLASEAAPNDAQIWYNRATSEHSLGNHSKAYEACSRALDLDRGFRPAVLLRSEISRATSTQNNISDLRERLLESSDTQARGYILFALGKELHEIGLYDEAFKAFAEASAIKRRSLQYDVATDEHKLRRIAEAFHSRKTSPERPAPGQHVFIIGLPRSGTTLTERLVGGLAGIRSNNETNNFSTALMHHTQRKSGDVFSDAAQADFKNVAAHYNLLAAHDGYAGKIIEKLPFNYLYVGAILQALPDASIIWVRRNPMDSCFAMYRTLFGAAYPFSYDFEDLARYYAAYSKLMEHWAELYSDRIAFVDYEQLVSKTDSIGPELASFCGLDWNNDALDITSNSSASLTASAAQIRTPINTRSVHIWREYGTHLSELEHHLSALGIDCRSC
ncbi:sulfotransferase [Hyphomonas sp.]|uniref:tetratricopeptide repeat-containing sulfotransferase family protein n=1 Tax=Hyphomonas sp. TaxID=87 RepID=UPI003242EA9C